MFTAARKAFTLIELLIVIAIIGMLSTLVLSGLKDAGNIQAKQLTVKTMQNIKDGIIAQESSGDLSGFLNDFGTLPPNLHFMLDRENANYFINTGASGEAKTLGKYRIADLYSVANTFKVPMPFLTDNTTVSGKYIDPAEGMSVIDGKHGALYVGFHDSYLAASSNLNKTLKDGWNTPIEAVYELNIADTTPPTPYVKLISYGSDKQTSAAIPHLKPEFNEFATDTKSVKALYADDIGVEYAKNNFMPRSLSIDLVLENSADITAVRVIIYSPMLYYVPNTTSNCIEKNTINADCGGTDIAYKPFLTYASGFSLSDAMQSTTGWHAGAVKYAFDIDLATAANDTLTINNTAYDFHDSAEGTQLGITTFIKDIRISTNTQTVVTHDRNTDDAANPFYITAGEKQVVIMQKKAGAWELLDSRSMMFLPNQNVIIQ
ncbi:MAG: type II secretion system protein [Campylobacterales bacterium]|nr:type II secretion system protein [Campylobacterales bacterium]